MPHQEKRPCRRRALSACAFTSLVLLVGLLMFVIIHLAFNWQDIVGKDQTSDLNDAGCRSKAAVVRDDALMRAWYTSTNFSQAWSSAEQRAREPAHDYMEKHHSTAIYMYTNMLAPKQVPERTRKPSRETFESRSLYSSLSEAIQILKHSQVTCLRTNYRAETLLSLNVSHKLNRFSSFIVGSDGWNFTRNSSCFEVCTCFGADVTLYSASRQKKQVLIPPYEVFTVADVTADVQQRCAVSYRLKSNLNCVYDEESNMLHPISASVEGFWIIVLIICMIIVSLLSTFVIVRVFENLRKAAVCSTDSPAQAVL